MSDARDEKAGIAYWNDEALWTRQSPENDGQQPAPMEQWSAHWYGSEPSKGCTIWSLTPAGSKARPVAYIGPDREHLDLGRVICAAHNAVVTGTAPAQAEIEHLGTVAL